MVKKNFKFAIMSDKDWDEKLPGNKAYSIENIFSITLDEIQKFDQKNDTNITPALQGYTSLSGESIADGDEVLQFKKAIEKGKVHVRKIGKKKLKFDNVDDIPILITRGYICLWPEFPSQEKTTKPKSTIASELKRSKHFVNIYYSKVYPYALGVDGLSRVDKLESRMKSTPTDVGFEVFTLSIDIDKSEFKKDWVKLPINVPITNSEFETKNFNRIRYNFRYKNPKFKGPYKLEIGDIIQSGKEYYMIGLTKYITVHLK